MGWYVVIMMSSDIHSVWIFGIAIRYSAGPDDCGTYVAKTCYSRFPRESETSVPFFL